MDRAAEWGGAEEIDGVVEGVWEGGGEEGGAFSTPVRTQFGIAVGGIRTAIGKLMEARGVAEDVDDFGHEVIRCEARRGSKGLERTYNAGRA